MSEGARRRPAIANGSQTGEPFSNGSPVCRWLQIWFVCRVFSAIYLAECLYVDGNPNASSIRVRAECNGQIVMIQSASGSANHSSNANAGIISTCVPTNWIDLVGLKSWRWPTIWPMS